MSSSEGMTRRALTGTVFGLVDHISTSPIILDLSLGLGVDHVDTNLHLPSSFPYPYLYSSFLLRIEEDTIEGNGPILEKIRG